MAQRSEIIGGESAQRCHERKSEHEGKNSLLVQVRIDEKCGQNNRDRQVVNGNPDGQIVVIVPHRKSFQESVNTKTDEQQPWNMGHIVMAVNVTMFGTFGEKFQNNLEQNPQHDENPNVVIVTFYPVM